jgi:hypothetical protein
MRTRSILAVAALLAVAGSAVAQADEIEFYAQGHKVECAISDDAIWHGAMCQVPGAHYVLLHATGTLTICNGASCPYSNAAENTRTLRTGASRTAGRFSCTAKGATIRCAVRATGHGFTISPAGARKLVPAPVAG